MAYAHSKNDQGQGHDLVTHLDEVGALAEEMAAKFHAGDLARLAGWWHDLGKFSSSFQTYIRNPQQDRRRGAERDHATTGALHAIRTLPPVAANLVAWVIAGHHSGLADQGNLQERLRNSDQERRALGILQTARQNMPTWGQKPTPSLPPFLSGSPSNYTLDFFIRMLYSVLTDADFLDTEKHFKPREAALRGRSPALDTLWPQLEARVATLACQAKNQTGPVNQVRQAVYQDCVRAAELPSGVFRLVVPTGGGKTLSSMAFALRHAVRHGLERVIVAIPYTSIVEQTADEYARVFGEDTVLEHHSAVEVDDSKDNEDFSANHMAARLASQNWDAAIVVTTTVQLFDSVFANRSSRLRKLHNLARSVLILDEAQTLPTGLLEPVLDALQELTSHYGTTVVLCSATLPDYQDTAYRTHWPEVTDIVPNPEQHFVALRRVRYELPQAELPWEQVAEKLRAERQCLTVVNTRNDALALFYALDDPEAIHLSTWLCGAHRREVLAQVRRRLKADEPCRLVATQVVEAGVDLDFPVVFRSLGPLDRIVQAAGRCNREGKLAEGRVVVFNPPGSHTPPGVYRAGLEVTRRLLNAGVTDLDSPATHRRYFRDWFASITTDEKGIQKLRQEFKFEEVARRFHLIGDDTVPALANYHLSHAAQNAVTHIYRTGQCSRADQRLLQPYLVSLRQRQVPQLDRQGLVRPLSEGLWQWVGEYDSRLGIGKAQPDPDQWVT